MGGIITTHGLIAGLIWVAYLKEVWIWLCFPYTIEVLDVDQLEIMYKSWVGELVLWVLYYVWKVSQLTVPPVIQTRDAVT